MKTLVFRLALAVVLATAPMLTACSDDDDDDAPPSHTENRGGVNHAPQGVDCTACHGLNNSGGSGPACSNCHK